MNLARFDRRGNFASLVGFASIALTASLALASGGGEHGGGGHGGGGDSHGKAEAAEEETISAASSDGTRAVKLGEFSIRIYHSASSRKDTVTFILQARISKDSFEAFECIYPQHKIKVRDQVIVATRLVPIEDYDDPELKKFRRRVYLRLRRTIPELPIDDVYLSDFTLSVQST
ncbi:MAG: hypothetical protein AB7G28_22270 [Pirellulales bacterium]